MDHSGRVTEVARSTRGDLEAIAKAVESLKTDDKGVNAARRQHEADMIRSSVQVQPVQPLEIKVVLQEEVEILR